jgi:hypothetical protein
MSLARCKTFLFTKISRTLSMVCVLLVLWYRYQKTY